MKHKQTHKQKERSFEMNGGYFIDGVPYMDCKITGDPVRNVGMEAKSVITNPSPEKPLFDHGLHQLRGLAWSGRGRIKRVDVSIDGGKNWRTAQIHGPVLKKCLTRFSIPFEWYGEEILIQSRAIDETGYVQPTVKELQDIRGVNSIYHNNSIATWLINKNGTVDNVRLG